ncbi:DUF2796 domain-containing protein [Pseudomonas sp. HR96]|uniref:DUF2796 domain-containing protein n=1 Tax=Pseudomonas sp. HR96 TaxID=1027966 RepID=UPI002A752EDA|nr:DUF2796 domain-containing protein [Pseudomonas sp. HR96]WPO99490.1 DUF2796 domain-containing protein [Pseudomonas sp. HR96]
MPRLLIALPFALLPLFAVAVHADEQVHAGLGTHEHGVAQLDAALDGSVLELELRSPAMNLVGFEHPASSAEDQAKVAQMRKQLEQPLALFQLDSGAGCHVTTQTLQSPLFGDQMPSEQDDDGDGDDHQHSEVHAHYQLTCSHPAALHQLGLAPLFKTFPATRRVQVQLIAPSGQQGLDASAAAATLTF